MKSATSISSAHICNKNCLRAVQDVYILSHTSKLLQDAKFNIVFSNQMGVEFMKKSDFYFSKTNTLLRNELLHLLILTKDYCIRYPVVQITCDKIPFIHIFNETKKDSNFGISIELHEFQRHLLHLNKQWEFFILVKNAALKLKSYFF